MIPSVSDRRWSGLVTGQTRHQFKFTPCGLLVSRINRDAQRDASPERIQALSAELRAFFVKYERLLSEDVAALF